MSYEDYEDVIEMEDTREEDGPCEGDIMLTDCGPLGCRTCVSVYGGPGKVIGEAVEWDDIVDLIRDHMEKEQFWPNVWRVSDHGNISLVEASDLRTSDERERMEDDLDALHAMAVEEEAREREFETDPLDVWNDDWDKYYDK